MDDATLDALADLLVGFGANVQPGQIVALDTEIGKEEMTRRVAASAYRHGARFVDVQYFDPWVKRARIEHAAEDTLPFIPSWMGARVRALGDQRAARIRLEGSVAPGLLDDLDPARAGLDQLPRIPESIEIVSERTTNWTIGPVPTEAWAQVVFPDLPPAEALDALWHDVVHMLRLDESDPVAAWRSRQDDLVAAAEKLTERRFDAIRLSGPGTDLTVGLMPSSRWITARFSTIDGIVHAPNLPSEEVFTTPDPARVDGHVTATRPLSLAGAIVRGMKVRFAGGRVTEIRADTGRRGARGPDGARTRARAASASWPWSTAAAASARSAGRSTTPCSTRTRPATWPSGRPTASPSRTRASRSGPTARRSTSTSWSARSRSTWTGSRRAGTPSPCSATAAGSSEGPEPAASLDRPHGEVPEWLNGRDWKSRNGGQPRSRVRIPPSPLIRRTRSLDPGARGRRSAIIAHERAYGRDG